MSWDLFVECVCVCVCVWERERERERNCGLRKLLTYQGLLWSLLNGKVLQEPEWASFIYNISLEFQKLHDDALITIWIYECFLHIAWKGTKQGRCVLLHLKVGWFPSFSRSFSYRESSPRFSRSFFYRESSRFPRSWFSRSFFNRESSRLSKFFFYIESSRFSRSFFYRESSRLSRSFFYRKREGERERECIIIMIKKKKKLLQKHTNDIHTHLVVWNFSDVAHILHNTSTFNSQNFLFLSLFLSTVFIANQAKVLNELCFTEPSLVSFLLVAHMKGRRTSAGHHSEQEDSEQQGRKAM